eukprot:TRINITY_DN17202_c0_g1_i1.p1 TRINITY_DN17202_c0_g1~~TRINITY_DN17202_c0_g1_i1.p1  ORF type:complete len:375 (+),score=90.10 TRINITY_DN17202_c0_g1_i1:51-1175(+)
MAPRKPAAKKAAAKKAAKPGPKKAAPKGAARKKPAAKAADDVPAHIKYDDVPPIDRRVEGTVKAARKGAVVFGVDEAGRGPLFGPVVVAACALPESIPQPTVEVVKDSKKLSSEKVREKVYAQLVAVQGLRYATACVSVQHIDARNILQASMDGMVSCCHALMDTHGKTIAAPKKKKSTAAAPLNDGKPVASVECDLCESTVAECSTEVYCVSGTGTSKPKGPAKRGSTRAATPPFHALIDGNRIPKELKCTATSIVSGDACELSIAAASIIAKVTRDRLMHKLAEEHSVYNIAANKGYPTEQHRALLMEHGACPQHRRSYRPVQEALKLMERRLALEAKRKNKRTPAAAKPKSAKKPTKKAAKKPTGKKAKST